MEDITEGSQKEIMCMEKARRMLEMLSESEEYLVKRAKLGSNLER